MAQSLNARPASILSEEKVFVCKICNNFTTSVRENGSLALFIYLRIGKILLTIKSSHCCGMYASPILSNNSFHNVSSDFTMGLDAPSLCLANKKGNNICLFTCPSIGKISVNGTFNRSYKTCSMALNLALYEALVALAKEAF